MLFERTTDFDGAMCRRFRARVEDQRHAVARWNLD